MFRTLLYKEIFDHLTRFRFVFAFLLCFVLVVTSVALRALDHKEKLANYSTSVQVFEGFSRSHQQSVYLGIEGVKIPRRPEVLSTMVEGVTDLVPNVESVSIISSRLQDGGTGESPVKRAFESIDYNFIVRLIVSLLALLFSYDAIAGERERGTLRALLANSLPRSQLLAAKMVSGYICAMIPLIFSTGVGLLLIHLFSGESFSTGDWQRFGLIFLVSAVYVALFFFIGLLLSILCRASKTALLSAFFVWITFILIVPNLAALLAAYFRPAPSRTEMLERKRLIEAQENDKRGMRMLKASREGGMDVITRESSQWAFEMATAVNARLITVEDAYLKRLQRQSSLVEYFTLISPASAYYYAAMDLAGTGLRAEAGFHEQLRHYSSTFIRYIKSKVESENDLFATIESADPVRVDDMPRFRHQREFLSKTLADSAAYLIQLLIFCAVLIAGCYFTFSRSDVRNEF